jgi:DNA transposition AAA+ family ATPase
VRAVAEAVGQAMAAGGAACVFGDAGRGKTVALRMAVSDPPVGWGVSWVRVPVRPSVSELRRAVFEALVLPGRFPHRSAEADERIVGALDEARVLVVDEAQRLPVPGGHGDPELAAGRSGPPRPVRGSGRPSICPWRLAPRCPACC